MIVIVLFLLLIILLLFLTFRVRIVGRDGKHFSARLYIGFWEVCCWRLLLVRRAGVIPYLYLERRKLCLRLFPKPEKKPPSAVLKLLKRAYRTERLHIDAVIGLEDAAKTALTVGSLRAAAGLFGRACADTRIAVTPEFSRETAELRADCIFSLRIADIIVKNRKGGNNNASYRKHSQKHDV